jgi:hypothetical protein|tara:strand:- start:1 stop:426 length:426 start_codon:yes stop_codon:yes gene_type:complete
MKKLLYLMVIGGMFTSCEKEDFELFEGDYDFKMTGRCPQDVNGYYHLPLIPSENVQTTHRFGAYVTNTDIFNLPTEIIWNCSGGVIPIINTHSYADPSVDSVYCMMAPMGFMKGDTINIQGQAWFEEGDVIKTDNINIILE